MKLNFNSKYQFYLNCSPHLLYPLAFQSHTNPPTEFSIN